MKRITAFILILTLMLAITPIGGAYTVGEKTIDIELSDYETMSNTLINNGVLQFRAGGRAVYQLYVPFDAVSMALKYTANEDDTTLEVVVDDNIYTNTVSGSSMTIKFSNVLRQGEHQVIIKADKAMEIYEITFNKYNKAVAPGAAQILPALTEFEKAIQTALIFSSKSPIIMVNGARRYVNNDNFREIPYVENGELYLPLHSFARAFGYYYEEQGEDIVLMKKNLTFLLKDGKFTKQINSDTPTTMPNPVKRVNGKKYLPIRYFAELEGKIISRRDDLFIVEFPSLAKEILADNIFNELKSRYNAYYLEENNGKTYYVSQECTSCANNDGSAEKPFKTIAKAAEVAQAGDTVIIKGGTYHEVLAPKNNGTASRPITFKAAEGEKVLLSACAELGQPSGSEGDMLIFDALTDLGDGRNQIFYKADNLTAGRHPNTHTSPRAVPEIEGLHSLWPTQGNIQVSSSKTTATSSTDLDQEEGYWVGGTLVALTGSAWSLGTAKISASEPGKLTLTDRCTMWFFAGKGSKTDYAYITDCKNTVDLPGEWAIEDGKIYIIPPEGETAETLKLEQKVRQVAIDLTNSKFVRVEGIDTYGGGMKMNNSEMCMLRDGEYRYISHYTHGMDQREGYIDSRDVYNPNAAPQRGELGIYLGGSDNIIINNRIAYSAGAGIYSVGKYGYIENNVVSDCGYMGSYVGGIYIATEGWKEPETPRGGNAIFNNTAYNVGRHAYGVCTHEDWYGNAASDPKLPAFLPDEVAYNDFYNGSIAARDTGTVYIHGAVLGTERLKSKLHNNVVYDSWSFDSFNISIYYDNWMGMGECYDNVTFHTDARIKPANSVFTQTTAYAQSYATIDQWNNMNAGLVEGGKAALTTDDYPNSKRFRSGADVMIDDASPYLNSLGVEESKAYYAKDAEISSGATLENGMFKPSKAGDYICFKDIDFSNGENQVVLYHSGDVYKTGDIVSVIVGNDINNSYVTTSATLRATSTYKWGKHATGVILVGDIPAGKTNVYIKTDTYKSFELEKIEVNAVESPFGNTKVSIYADTGEKVEGERASLSAKFPDGESHYYWQDTWGTTTLLYKGVEIKTACDQLLMRAGTKASMNGKPVDVRIGAIDGEVIGTIKVPGNGWDDYTVQKAALNRVLEPGTYDFYVRLKDANKTCNFLWFGFGVADEDESTDDAVTEDTSEETEETVTEDAEEEAVAEDTETTGETEDTTETN